jgi:acyl-homoserine lactone acylase PvdQ
VGTQPFFMGLAAPVRLTARPSADVTDVADVSSAAHAKTENNPSRRYLIHLRAPGWNVIGLTSPWLPGVAIGHNERIAWNLDRFDADTEDVYADPAGSSITSVIKDAIVVRGRAKPFAFDIERTPHGVVVATDRTRNLVFTVRWTGTEPGGAAELGAMAIDRARSWTEFRAAAARWKMPARKIVYADVDGHSGFQVAALVPIRRASEWAGWQTLDSLPHAFNVPDRNRTARPPAQSGDPIVFAHPLGITAASRRRFNIGPLTPRAPGASPFGAAFDPADWDRSHAVNPPGQSESPDSAHFADLAALWAAGESVPLAFTDAAVQANAETTLMLIPSEGRP